MLKYARKMHGGELWAKIEVLENVASPLLSLNLFNKGEKNYVL